MSTTNILLRHQTLDAFLRIVVLLVGARSELRVLFRNAAVALRQMVDVIRQPDVASWDLGVLGLCHQYVQFDLGRQRWKKIKRSSMVHGSHVIKIRRKKTSDPVFRGGLGGAAFASCAIQTNKNIVPFLAEEKKAGYVVSLGAQSLPQALSLALPLAIGVRPVATTTKWARACARPARVDDLFRSSPAWTSVAPSRRRMMYGIFTKRRGA